MDVESVVEYCVSKKGTTETFPFDETTLVLKVMNKMFALIPLESIDPKISLKCDPERAIELREEYEGIEGAYHMNKKHWNMVDLQSGISDALIRDLIDHSYELVVASLPKKDRVALSEMK